MLNLISVVAVWLAQAAFTTSSQQDVADKLQKWFPADQPLHIELAADGQLWEVTSGMQIFYVTQEADFIIPGPLLHVRTGENLTDRKLSLIRERLVSERPDDFFLTYPAANEQHRVTVITDVDCTYCRRLHAQMSDYNERGITMRYVLVSRGGRDAPAFRKAASAWCADRPEEAVTLAMSGSQIDLKDCENPLDQHQMLAQQLGLSSTPSLILPDGVTQVGYLTPDQLAEKLVSAKTADSTDQ